VPKKLRIPSYRFHKGSGQAVVVLNGTSVYLGKWQSPESHAEYERAIAAWLAHGRNPPRPQAAAVAAADPANDLRVSELILRFFDHAKQHYRHADGRPTGEHDNYRDALRPLRRLFGDTPAREFGPLRLRAVREAMVKDGLSRATVNARVHRIRRAFRWAASMELIPAAVAEALGTVAALQRGRCDAPESPGVKPVAWQDVEATLPHLPRPVAAMVEVMRFSNCRAEDVVMMRGCDIHRAEEVWEYTPASHKNQWREEAAPHHRRVVLLGPRCQAVLRPFLDRPAEDYLFSPQEARAAYLAERAKRRKTKRTPSELKRRRKAHPKRAPQNHYTVSSFQQTVRNICKKLVLPAWTVLQVRHSRATEIRVQYGLEGAAASLGDTVEAAAIYAEKNQGLARRIAKEVG
jgi:hypothetical protein